MTQSAIRNPQSAIGLVPVILSGFLAKRFGKRFELAVSSPREAVRALCSQLPGFEQAILSHPQGFRVWLESPQVHSDTRVTREVLPDSQSLDRCTGARPIRIVPVVAGAKSSGMSIILGAALIFAAPWVISGFTGIGGLSAGMSATLISGATGLGVSMILGGISQMLFSPPAVAANNRSNLLFSGAVNTTAQGNAVPVCYGRMLVGSQVISTGIESVQIP